MQKDNTTMVLHHFVAALAIPLTRKSISDELQRHPDYNSLLALSDVLDNWHIPNEAYKLTFEELLDADIEGPFIAYLSKKGFLMVNSLSDKGVIVSNEQWNKHQLSIPEFRRLYSGSILVAEKIEESGEADYIAKRRKEIVSKLRNPCIITAFVALLLGWVLFRTSYLTTLNWQIAALTLIKTVGLITVILLLVQSIDSNNPLINYLCGGNNMSCNAILSSKAAKVTDSLSWSEIGFFYFGGSWLVLLFNSNIPSIIALLALLNALCLPYTIYSIFHQWRIAKQWCRLCCAVQALLWLEFTAFVPSILKGIPIPSLNDLSSLIMGMATTILAWIFIKPYFLLSKQIKPLKGQLRQYKYNRDMFNRLLNSEVKYTLLDKDNSLIIGNPEAENVITMLTNPYCQPCATAHKQLDWLKGRDDVKFQVVFATKDDTDKPSEVALHLLALQQNQDDASLEKALDDWYELKRKDFAAWADMHPKTTTRIINSDALQKQRSWCELTEIISTPTIFFNGRKIPQAYKPDELKYFI